MGNFIQKGSLDMSKYRKEGSVQDTPTLTIDVLQNITDINDRALCKDITSVVRQMSPANQLEILKKISSQPDWFTFIKFDEWNQNQERMNVIHTKISNSSLDKEIVALRQSNLQPNAKNCWFLLTNLLLAVMDMEHRLDFFQSLSTKNIYLNSDRSMTILNPYFRDSHLQKILEDVIIPAKNCPGWREEFGQSYYARMAAIDSNKQLSDLHYVHQGYVKDMLKSVGVIMLAFLSRRDENGYYSDTPGDNAKSWQLRYDVLNGDLNVLDQNGVDPDMVDIIEYLLKYEPSSAIEFGRLLNEAQYNKMLTCMRDATIVCADPKAVKKLFFDIKGFNPYDPKFSHKVSLQRNTQSVAMGPGQNYQLPPGFLEGDPNFQAFAPLMGGAQQPNIPVVAPSPAGLAPAKELDLLRQWTIGHEKSKEVLPHKVDFLNMYTHGKNKKKEAIANNVDFLKLFMGHQRTPDLAPECLPVREDPCHLLHCGCNRVCTCQHVHMTHMHHHTAPEPIHHHHHHKATSHLHLHNDIPQYSPYSHLYYMGSPLTGKEADLLHANPIASR